MSKPDTNEKKSPLREQLTHKTANVWSKATAAERKQIMEFGKEYSAFLDAAKTEREAVKEIVEVASRTGFSDLTGEGTGGRYFHNYKGKVASLFVNGSAPISAGLHIIVAHIDAPRLDLKQNPLYEDSGLAMLKTHYYGGIKKYQWVSRPLAMHGVVVLPDGKSIEICLGEDPADPVFTIADLLPHLWGKTQATKKAPEIITGEQLNLVFGQGYVITVQEVRGDPFDPVRRRLRKGGTMVRKAGADFLAYALIDAVVDGYFPLLRAFGDTLDDLEESILERPTQATLVRVKRARRTLLTMRRAIWPMRDAIATLQGDHVPFIQPGTRPYLRDVFDHALRILDICESYRDQVSGLMDGYMSAVSFRMNEVMGLLTLVGTIFLPLSFLTGLYGMNFDADSPWNMPELHHPYGYAILLAVMLVLSVVLLVAFYRRGWFEFLGSSRRLAARDLDEGL